MLLSPNVCGSYTETLDGRTDPNLHRSFASRLPDFGNVFDISQQLFFCPSWWHPKRRIIPMLRMYPTPLLHFNPMLGAKSTPLFLSTLRFPLYSKEKKEPAHRSYVFGYHPHGVYLPFLLITRSYR